MIDPNEAAFATCDGGTETTTTWQGQKGLTKREYFAVYDSTPLPDLFCLTYIRTKEKEEGGYRKTDGNYYDLLTVDEKVEVRALWKVKCADALITALNY